MRVFVLGTGRCGTVTFSKACKHIANYTCAHETPILRPCDLEFPDQHIEVSPHLTWLLGPLENRNASPTMYLHLRRKRSEVVESWVKRGQGLGPGMWMPLALRYDRRKLSVPEYREACGLCYDSIIAQIDAFLWRYECKTAFIPDMSLDVKVMNVWLHEVDKWWDVFWEAIGAEGDYEASLSEWSVHHNAS